MGEDALIFLIFISLIEVSLGGNKNNEIFRGAVEEVFFIKSLNFNLWTVLGELLNMF
jgi:hypothetical protein